MGADRALNNRRDMHPIKRFLLRNGDWTNYTKLSQELKFPYGSLGRILNYHTMLDYPSALALEEYSNGELRWQDLLEHQGRAWLQQAIEKPVEGRAMCNTKRLDYLRDYIQQKRAQRQDKLARISNVVTDHTDFKTIKRW